MTDIENAVTAIEQFGESQFRAGLEEGLAVAEKIVSWLSAQPDSKRQKDQRQWAITAIAKAREKYHG